ncbi:MAG: fibronectin type III domain-containing protein [Bacteroidales bacterium]|nr:fibronectin type III domain-containing protein [Bacteroidales bacterium]
MYFYNPSSYYTYLALPAMATGVDSLQVSFAAFKTGTYTIRVGVMNDPEDFSTFTEIATVSPASTNNWEMFEVPLRDYEGTGRYIALATGMSNYNYMYIDDIEVSLIPNCQRPTSITFSSITTTQASVAWVDTSATDFEIEYGPSGFALGTGTRVTSSLSSVTLYGLTHSTRYDVYVRGICTLSDTSNWSFVSSFITECGMISNLPYTQNFSNWGVGTGARPACWACGGYSSYPYIVNVTNSASQVIGRTLYMYSYASNRVYASLPELDSVTYPIHIVQTVFKAWTNNTTSTYYSHNLIVGVCSAQGELSTFTPIDTIELTDTPMEYEVSFDNAMGTGKYITFVSTAMDGATYNYVYIDSIAVELIPDCQRPNNLIASGMTATTAALSWNDRTSALGWEVEYNLHGFGVGSGTRITTISNPLNVTGLLPSTSYDFYVRAICGPGDTSDWSRTPYNFTTLQNPATVPYFYDMESSVEWDNWQIASNSPITWYRDTAAGNGTNGYGTTGTHSMYISADSGQTCSTHINEVVNAVAYRDFDFGNIDSSYILSFRASAGGCRVDNSVYDGLAVFMVDPNTPLQPSSNNPLVSPWGNVNDLTLLATVYCQPGWNTYTAIIDTLTGIHRIVFYWFNQNTTSIGIFLGSPAAVDDISIQYMECPRPAGVRATNVTMGSARVVWHGYEDADYRVTLRSSTGGIVSSTLVHGTNIHFSGLTPATTYNAYVRRLCGENDSSMLPSCSFTTLLCNDGTTDTIGNAYSTTTSYNIPVNNFYNYSYTQELVLASELGNNVGEISGINFYYTGSSAITSKAGCTIYMGHTTLSSFSSTTDIVDPADMSIVYTGNFNFSPGWNQIRLNNPYPYDGTRNLVIAIDDNSGHYQGTSYTFRTSPATAQMTVTYYSDSYNIDCSSLSALQSFTGTKEAYGYRNLFTLDICGPNSCPLPTLRDPIVRSHNVTLRWRNTGTTYNVGYRLATSSSWISNNITTTDTFYTINTLYPMTDYVYHVRQHCDTNGVSNWAEGQFNSSDVPCLSPMDLHLVSVTNSKAKLAWTPEENNIGYRLRIYNTYYDQTYTTYLASKTVTGLESNTRYYATVQATCQDLDDPSEWCDPISFVTDVCPDAYNLTASNVQGNSVDLDWSADDRHVGWVIEYGYEGFDAGSGVAVEADHHPFQLTGLTGETTYDIFVRGVCGSNFMSENWSNRVTITTLYSGIHSITDDVRVHLFPNPTSSDVELTLPAVGSAVKVEVIDVAGRTQLSCTLPVGTEKATLATSQLPQGAYYVRVTGGDINTIKKLVVR